jgi:signal transduction histidine kinase
MKAPKRKPSLMLILIAGLIALLPLLAVLQFRWLGEVSRAERERMQASLKTAVSNFSQDFDRELTRAYLSFQMDRSALRERDWNAYAKRYDAWRQSTLHAELVSAIFLVEPGENREPRLLRFNRSAARFTPAEWPAELAAFRQCAVQDFKGERDDTKLFGQRSIDALSDDAPGLVMPIPEMGLLERRELHRPLSFAGYVLVTFDIDFIRDQFIPGLAARYFKTGDRLDYNLTVISRRNPERIIYQSAEHSLEKLPSPVSPSPDALSSGDATANIFGVRIDMPAIAEGMTEDVEKSTGNGEKQERVAVQFFNLEVRKQKETTGAARAGGSQTGGSQADPAQIIPAQRVALLASDTGRWQAILTHRSGSLDTAVASARRRNIVISGGILLVLSVSVAMIIVLSRRTAALARQQMEFVAGVSHELRTPLAVIRSAGENLADGVISEREQVRRYGALIEGEGRKLTEMVEQALEFAGIQSGRKTYELRPVEPGGIIEQAVAACQVLIRESGFEIEKEIEPHLPMVAADAAALNRSIQNLLSNAMKYGGESRWIKIKALRSETGPRAEVQITVQDRGIGIPASEVQHIFEPFYRARDVAAAQIRGSGLGLSLVKHIIEAHNGRVSVESAQGRGSAFTLHLPLAPRLGAEPSGQVNLAISEKG